MNKRKENYILLALLMIAGVLALSKYFYSTSRPLTGENIGQFRSADAGERAAIKSLSVGIKSVSNSRSWNSNSYTVYWEIWNGGRDLQRNSITYDRKAQTLGRWTNVTEHAIDAVAQKSGTLTDLKKHGCKFN